MSSVALAVVLALPPAEEIVRVIDRADTATVVGALSEMSPASAASLVLAMDPRPAAEVLKQAGPALAADILRVSPRPAGGRNCPAAERSRASVRSYLGG